jgi:DNA repair protein RadD
MNMLAPIARKLELYDYQKEAVEKIRRSMSAGWRRVILAAPTAFGKTETSIYILLAAMNKGSIVWFIVDRKVLIKQTSDRLSEYGIDHGIIQADHPGWAPEKPVQLIMAQTLARRPKAFAQLPPPDLIVYDEAHAEYKGVLDIIERHRAAFAFGLTATPFTAGMAGHWDGVVNGATVNQLLAIKRLTPLKIKACVAPDMADVKRKSDGEYDEEEAGQRGITIVGDVAQTWIAETQKHFGGPVKTIAFVSSVEHGRELCRQMADAGFNFQQISYLDKSDAERDAKIAEFRKPDSVIHGLVSCAVLTKGFDVPDVKCGISCRPYTRSFSSHIQEQGRVMRVAANKEFGLWLDHSGNCIAFADDTAWLYEYGVDSLSTAEKKDSEVREPTEKLKKKHFCGDCGMQMEPTSDACPSCGWQRPVRGEIQTIEGELIDFEISTKASFQPRHGLRAECLNNPRAMWNAALAYCFANGRRGPDASRKWAYGVWAGIYPNSKLPHGLYGAKCNSASVAPEAFALVEREINRFRKHTKQAA